MEGIKNYSKFSLFSTQNKSLFEFNCSALTASEHKNIWQHFIMALKALPGKSLFSVGKVRNFKEARMYGSRLKRLLVSWCTVVPIVNYKLSKYMYWVFQLWFLTMDDDVLFWQSTVRMYGCFHKTINELNFSLSLSLSLSRNHTHFFWHYPH